MPRSKTGVKRKRTEEDLQALAKAVECVAKGGKTPYAASKEFEVPISTINRQVKKFKNSGEIEFSYIQNNDTQKVFTGAEEEILAEYIETAAKLNYGCTLTEVRELAYQFAQHNKKKFPKKWEEEGMAGEYWLRLFRKKYADRISLRKPEATSLARSISFNRPNVAMFFGNYRSALQRTPISSVFRLWNLDEKGCSTVHKPPKVLAVKGLKQVGGMTSLERGNLVTMISAANAGGGYIPPLLVFPRVNFKDFMIKGAPPGTIGAASPSGWSNEKIFIQFFDHFLLHSGSSKTNPTILLMDNHESHISVPVIEAAKNNGVTLVTFHPHTTHKMQPLDRSVFGPFQKFYDQAMNDWMKRPGNVGKPVTIYDVSELVGKVWPLAFTPTNIMNGFKAAGIEPLNENIFTDADFLPSNVSDRPLPLTDENQSSPQISTKDSSATTECDALVRSRSESSSGSAQEPQPSTSTDVPRPTIDVSKATSMSVASTTNSPPVVSPQEIRPFPKAQPRKSTNQGRKKGKSCILTDTPEKLAIEQEKQERLAKKLAKEQRKLERAAKKAIGTKKVARVVRKKLTYNDSETESEEDTSMMLNESEDSEGSEDFEDLVNPDNEKIEKGTYILTKICAKRSTKYFVAEVCEIGNNLSIKYLKKLPGSQKFCREDDKLYETDQSNVVLVLPHPTASGGSARQLHSLTFAVDLSSYPVE